MTEESLLDIVVKKSRKSIASAREGEKVQIEIYNHGGALRDALLLMGEEPVHVINDIGGGEKILVPYVVSDYVGRNLIHVKGSDGGDLCPPVEFFVEPASISVEDYNYVKKKRIPDVMKKLNADNVIEFVYEGGSTTLDVTVIEYHVEQLMDHYSKMLFDISKKIMDRLDYLTYKERDKYIAQIKGKVNWPKTAIYQNSKGLEQRLGHVCDRRRKTHKTPLNILLLVFHYSVLKELAFLYMELERREIEKLKWKAILGYEGKRFDEEAVQRLSSIKERLKRHRMFLMQTRFQSFLGDVRPWSQRDSLLLGNARKRARICKNRSYKDMVSLWEEFKANYTPMFDKMITVDTQRMKDIYEFWVVCEIVNSLDLFSLFASVREFKNRTEDTILFYQKIESFKDPWLEGGESDPVEEMNRPDIMVSKDGNEVYVSTEYELKNNKIPKEKVFQVLGQMGAYGVDYGIIFYPGDVITVKHNKRKKKFLMLCPLKIKMPEDKTKEDAIGAYIREVFDFVESAKQNFVQEETLDAEIMQFKERWESITDIM